MGRYRARRRRGRLSLLTVIGVLLLERRLQGGRRTSFIPRRHEWAGFAREATFRRFGPYSPASIALRAGSRLLRRFGI